MIFEMNDNIIPYEGIGEIKLGMRLDDIREYLKSNQIKFDQWIESNEGYEPEIPWVNIRIKNSITLTFVKNILFEILLQNEYKGALPNGTQIDMEMNEVEQIEPSLKYDDDDEIFVSDNGYWIGDEIESGKVVSITIFLPDVELEDDEFWKYEWLEKYL